MGNGGYIKNGNAPERLMNDVARHPGNFVPANPAAMNGHAANTLVAPDSRIRKFRFAVYSKSRIQDEPYY
ncbi:hypothetical protein RRSWK_01204 [Rhodopirellula sp. SWK7]|nr:hypothetical protein RRSWK_01204 [Rhodopirellula sp. SWK7]